MSDVFKLAGATLDLAATDALPTRYRERFGTIPSLTIPRRAIQPPPESADTWMGKSLTWAYNGTTYFSGFIRSRSLRRDPVCGWIVDYQALGLRDLMDKFPLTDKTTGLDVSPFNCAREDLINYAAARAGRTVGQILTDVLTSTANAVNLNAYGLGNYTGLPTTPALPAATVADLAALTIIPPRPCYVTGEKLGGAIDGFLAANAPNVRMWVKPNGDLRFLDLTTFGTGNTLTMGSDPIEPSEISRDVGDCWQRVQIRGAPIALMFIFKVSAGTLLEDFPWGTNTTNALAKAAWHTTDFTGVLSTQDTGTCTMGATTTVTVTSTNAAENWPSNYWDQTSTGAKGTVNLYASALVGVTSVWTSPIVSNTALVAAGTSTLTISDAAPNTSYNQYTITGFVNGPALVWRKYKIADSTLWPLMVAQSTYPQAFTNAGGGATLTSTPIGSVFWHQSGSAPPDNMFPLPFLIDASTGHIYFTSPTYIVANNQAPSDVWAMIPINTGPNLVSSPVDSGGPVYSGDSRTIEGLADTLVVTMPDWRDPGQKSQVQAFADDLLKSVHDGVREGSITYHGMYEPALTFGLAMNIAGLKDNGTADTTGWEAAHLPIVGVDIEWSQGADDYITTMHLSSRRAHFSADMFMRPERRFTAIGLPEGSDTLIAGGGGYKAAAAGVGAMADQAGAAGKSAAADAQGLSDQAAAGKMPLGGGQTDLGAPTIGAGYGGGGDLGIPTDMRQLGVPTTLADAGVDPTGGNIIPQTPGQALQQAGADPFGGMNPQWGQGGQGGNQPGENP